MKKDNCSRREFIKFGAFAGASMAAMSAVPAFAAEEAKEEEGIEAADVATEGDEVPQGDTIYIIDHIQCKPGQGQEIFDHYMAEYVPDAEKRGMTLVNKIVQPPIWLTDEVGSNSLEFIWSVPGMMGWVMMVGTSRYDPEMAPKLIDFWYDIDDRVASRTRTLSAPDTDVESLTTLAKLGM